MQTLGLVSDLGEASRCRLRGEGVRLRLLLTSPFLAPGPVVDLLGPSSSEEEDPESETTDADDISNCLEVAFTVCRKEKTARLGVRTQLQKSMRR